MSRSRNRVVATVLLGVAVLTVLAGTGAAGNVLMVDVSASNDAVGVGENVTLTTELTAPQESSSDYRVSEIVVRDVTDDSDDVVTEEQTILRVGPGESGTIDTAVSFDSPGERQLEVTVIGEVDGDQFRVSDRLTVSVEETRPRVSIGVQTNDAGESVMAVTVANGRDDSIRSVVVNAEPTESTVKSTRTVFATIGPGESKEYTTEIISPASGTEEVRVDVSYVTDNGETRHVSRTLDVTPSSTDGAVRLGVQTSPTMPGSATNVSFNVANGLDESVRSVKVQLDSKELTFDQSELVSSKVAAGQTQTFTVRATGDTTGEATVHATVTYVTASGTEYTRNVTLRPQFTAPKNPADIQLTGVEVVQEGDSIHVSGVASNIGGTTADAVTVRVLATDEVSNQTEASYFVGQIGASDFGSFDVTAQVRGNHSTATVPVQIAYTVDGVRVTETRNVTVTLQQTQTSGSNSGGVPGIVLVPVGFVVVAAGGAAWWYRD